MTTNTEPSIEWRACQPGEIGAFARRLRWRGRRPLLGVAVATVAGVAMVGAALLLTAEHEYHGGGITCSEVRARTQDFLSSRVHAELRQKIELHLAKCPECGPLFRRMLNEPDPQVRIPDSGPHLASVRPHGCACAACRSLLAHRRAAAADERLARGRIVAAR